jgi:hypothetical protein
MSNVFSQYLQTDPPATKKTRSKDPQLVIPPKLKKQLEQFLRNQNRQKKNSEKAVKSIGRPIGATGDPVDGDGDGFYTPFEGAPDKTPVPAAYLTEEGLDESVAIGAEGVKAYRAMKDQVRKKYGEIKTHQQAREALQKAFPNANIKLSQTSDSDKVYNFADEDLREEGYEFDPDFGTAVGLLHMAELYPEVAERIVELNSNMSEYPAGVLGMSSYRLFAKDTGFGLTMNLRRYQDNPFSGRTNAAYINQIANTAPVEDQDAEDKHEDEISELAAAYVAIHEMGHAIHHTAVLKDLKVPPPSPNDKTAQDQNGNEYKFADPMPFYKSIFKLTEQQEKTLRQKAQERINQEIKYIENIDGDASPLKNPDTAEWQAAYQYGLFAAIANMQGSHEALYELMPEIEKFEKDGLTELQYEQLGELLANFGEYAATKPSEGVAEAIAAKIFGYPIGKDINLNKFLNWLNIKTAETKNPQNQNTQITLCTGIGATKPTPTYTIINTHTPPKQI